VPVKDFADMRGDSMPYFVIQNLSVHYGKTVALQGFSMEMDRDELAVVVGPSGSGKTTLLHALCGLVSVRSGSVTIRDRRIDRLPPGKRRIAMVFQDGALFPHLNVFGNIELPLRAEGLPKSARQARVERIAELLEISQLLKRRPEQISGGEQQRVAIARALVKEPDLFLLDEPFGSLDPTLRHRMAEELVELHRRLRVPILHVTHDQSEALALGTRVIVLDQGTVQQSGSPEQIYGRPQNLFVARFIGYPPMNLVTVHDTDHSELMRLLPVSFGLPLDEDIIVGFRPEDVHIEPDGDAILLFRQLQGHEQIAVFEYGSTRISARLKRGKPLEEGGSYQLSVPRGQCHLFSRSTGSLLK
jgi:ABC-type sugar transport system ATPase subunit